MWLKGEGLCSHNKLFGNVLCPQQFPPPLDEPENRLLRKHHHILGGEIGGHARIEQDPRLGRQFIITVPEEKGNGNAREGGKYHTAISRGGPCPAQGTTGLFQKIRSPGEKTEQRLLRSPVKSRVIHLPAGQLPEADPFTGNRAPLRLRDIMQNDELAPERNLPSFALIGDRDVGKMYEAISI